MSPEWFYFYGKMLNMSFLEIRYMIIGRMLDLIGCYQIKKEGASMDYNKVEAVDDDEVIPHWR